MIVFHWIILRMRNIVDNLCRENQYTFFIQCHFFWKLYVYEIMWKNTLETDRPHTLWGMHLACWITKAANTHSVSNTYFFSTATVVRRTCQNVACVVVMWFYYFASPLLVLHGHYFKFFILTALFLPCLHFTIKVPWPLSLPLWSMLIELSFLCKIYVHVKFFRSLLNHPL